MNTVRINTIISVLLLCGIIGIQAQNTNNQREQGAVAYDLPGMNDLI